MSRTAAQTLILFIILSSILWVSVASLQQADAQASFNYTLSLSTYSLSVAPSHGGYVQLTVSLASGSSQPVNLTTTVSPQDGQLSTSLGQSSGTPTFMTTLTVTAYAAPAGKQYEVVVTGSSQGLTRQAPTLTVTISCPQGPCPQPHLDSTDRATYGQGQSIQFVGSGFIPGDGTASCLTNNNTPPICQSQTNADNQGHVSGSMLVTPAVPPGTEFFYLKDTTNDQQTQVTQLTITSSAATAALITVAFGGGAVTPSCPSGCSEPVGQPVSVAATPQPNWTFSGWNITGATCSFGNSITPCTFTMPGTSVAVTANFIQTQSQPLFTSYTGMGIVSPSCPSGCMIAIGSMVNILATPAAGWAIGGYHVTSGVTCSSQGGYTCTFPMPNFPVTFQVGFTENSSAILVVITATTTIQTSVTSPTTIISQTASATTLSTISATQTGKTETITAYTTSTGGGTETQESSITQYSIYTATVAAVASTLANPILELALAGIILLSALTIGVSLIQRSPRRGTVSCSKCGFKNFVQSKYCVNCGDPLGAARSP